MQPLIRNKVWANADAAASAAGTAAQNATPWGAIIGGAKDVINNVVNNLFKSKQEKDKMDIQKKLQLLNEQQNYVLAQQLQQAHTETERMEILTNAVSHIKETQLTNASNSSNKTLTLVLVGSGLLAVMAYIIAKA